MIPRIWDSANPGFRDLQTSLGKVALGEGLSQVIFVKFSSVETRIQPGGHLWVLARCVCGGGGGGHQAHFSTLKVVGGRGLQGMRRCMVGGKSRGGGGAW
jgi:hypothetical protein